MTNKMNFDRRPLLFSALNKVWKGSYLLGTEIRLDADDMIRRAKKKTGLTYLGKDFEIEPLQRLLHSVNYEANLHAVGRFITRERFVSLISIRLRAEYFFKKYPEILEQPLYPAWIIIGLQRTGTTKLQRLLAADPDHRVIPSWEVINPVPLDLDLYTRNQIADTGSRQPAVERIYPDPRDKRIAMAKMSVNAVRFMSPGFFAIHPIEYDQPEEDILMLDVSFMSTTPEAMMNVPSYASWLETIDQSAAYAYAARLLKFLQWIKPAKRWILKTPHHLEFPDLVGKHFGDVHFLWPHRRIYESVPSYLSMLTYNHMIFSDEVDEFRIARHWVRKTGYMLHKALDYRLRDQNQSKFTDIYYKDLITDSMEELKKIYQMKGGLTPALIQSFGEHEREHPHRKYGTHNYSLADFGLTEADIDRHTAHYQQFMAEHYDRAEKG